MFYLLSHFFNLKVLGFLVFNLYIKYRKLSYKFRKPSREINTATTENVFSTSSPQHTKNKVTQMIEYYLYNKNYKGVILGTTDSRE